MSLTIDTAYTHGKVVEKMVNYGFGMPTRLVADGDVARWCGRLVAHYGGTKALVVLGGDKHTRDELVSAALGSLDRALLERVLFRCGLVGGDGGDELIDEAVALATDEGVDFVLAIGDADTAGFARELARRMAVLDAYQGQGLGSILLKEAEDFAQEQGFQTISLHAQLGALRFYLNNGYQEVGNIFEEAGIQHITVEKSLLSKKA